MGFLLTRPSSLSSTTTTVTMSLNWVMLNPDRSPVPLKNEMTITAIDSGVDLALTIPDAPPSNSSSAGGSGGVRKLKAIGKIWLTDQRVCSLSLPATVSMLIHIMLDIMIFMILVHICNRQQ